MRNLRTFALGALAIIGLGAALGAAQTIRNPLRYIPPPSTFYVATTGSNGNKCTQAAPCLTVAHALNYALTQYDFQGNDITISVGAGTFSGDQITITGNNPGASTTTFTGWVQIIGAGKASTTLENTTCGTGNNTINAAYGARVRVGSMTLATSCPSGSTLAAFDKATIGLADTNVKLSTAAWAKVYIAQASAFNSAYGFEIAGSGFYAFNVANQATILFGPATVTITGTPAFSESFVTAINSSLFADGGSTYSGSATGTTYSINTGSQIDRESETSSLPGNTMGILGYASAYVPTLVACMGGDVGCSISDVPTGLGTNGTATLSTAGARMGTISLNTGSGSTAASGSVYVGLPAQLLNGVCTAQGAIGTTRWASGTVFQTQYDTTAGNAFALIQWYNGGAANLDTGTDYKITYACDTAG